MAGWTILDIWTTVLYLRYLRVVLSCRGLVYRYSQSIISLHGWSNNAKSSLILTSCISSFAAGNWLNWRLKVKCSFGSIWNFKIISKLISNPLFISNLLDSISFFLSILLLLLLINLFLERFSHDLSLFFPFNHDDFLLIPALKYGTLFLKFNVHSVFSHFCSCHDCWKVSFRLKRGVVWVLRLSTGHTLVQLWLLRLSVRLIRLFVFFLNKPLLLGLLGKPLLLHCRLVIRLLLLLVSGNGNWLILIIGVLRLLASRMYLLLYPCSVTSSNLLLQFFSKPLLFHFFFTSWIALDRCLDVPVEWLVIVMRLSHFLHPAKTACCFLIIHVSLLLLVVED